jgi:sporulation protein YlmC with PRC-barrel domain
MTDQMTAESQRDTRAQSASERVAHPLIPAQRVNGADVFNQAKERIGKIEDIAIDKGTGKVAYAILSFGGFMGLGDKHQPLPWSVLEYDIDLGGYVVPITEEFLKLAPKLDVSELSGWDDTQTREAFHTYYSAYGVRPYWW